MTQKIDFEKLMWLMAMASEEEGDGDEVGGSKKDTEEPTKQINLLYAQAVNNAHSAANFSLNKSLGSITDRFSSEVIGLQEKLRAAEVEISILTAQVETITGDRGRLRQLADQYKAACATAKQERDGLRGELIEAKEQLDESKRELDEVNKKIEVAGKMITSVADVVASFRHTTSSAKAYILFKGAIEKALNLGGFSDVASTLAKKRLNKKQVAGQPGKKTQKERKKPGPKPKQKPDKKRAAKK